MLQTGLSRAWFRRKRFKKDFSGTGSVGTGTKRIFLRQIFCAWLRKRLFRYSVLRAVSRKGIFPVMFFGNRSGRDFSQSAVTKPGSNQNCSIAGRPDPRRSKVFRGVVEAAVMMLVAGAVGFAKQRDLGIFSFPRTGAPGENVFKSASRGE